MGNFASQLKKGSTPTLILSVLSVRPMYGYEIAKEIAQLSGGRLGFKEGTLYPALHQLERQGLIAGCWQEVVAGREGTPPRKYYTITEDGLRALAESAEELRQFARALLNIVGEGANA